eukprot:403364760
MSLELAPLLYPPLITQQQLSNSERNNIGYQDQETGSQNTKRVVKLKYKPSPQQSKFGNMNQKFFHTGMQAQALNLNSQLKECFLDHQNNVVPSPQNKNYPMRPIIKSYSQSRKLSNTPIPPFPSSASKHSQKWSLINIDIFKNSPPVSTSKQNELNSGSPQPVTLNNQKPPQHPNNIGLQNQVTTPEKQQQQQVKFTYRKATLNSQQQEWLLEQLKSKENSLEKVDNLNMNKQVTNSQIEQNLIDKNQNHQILKSRNQPIIHQEINSKILKNLPSFHQQPIQSYQSEDNFSPLFRNSRNSKLKTQKLNSGFSAQYYTMNIDNQQQFRQQKITSPLISSSNKVFGGEQSKPEVIKLQGTNLLLQKLISKEKSFMHRRNIRKSLMSN